MATLREQILANVKAALEGITIANGYNQDVEAVYVVPRPVTEINVACAINVIDRGDQSRRLFQFCLETRMTLEIEAVTREFIEAERIEEMQRLLADIKKRIYAQLDEDETWGELAVQSTIVSGGSPPWDVARPFNANSVTVEILYREQEGNPYVQQVI